MTRERTLAWSRGDFLLERGDYPAARARYEEGLAWRRARGADSCDIAWALLEVEHAAWLQGGPAATRSHAREALALFQEVEDEAGRLAALESLAVAALALGVLGVAGGERAARLLGAVEARREALAQLPPHWWRRPRERIGEAVRTASLVETYAMAWAEGRTMTLDRAIEYALAGEEQGS